MTVDELIKVLEQYDPATPVLVWHPYTRATDKLIVREWVYDPYDGCVMIEAK